MIFFRGPVVVAAGLASVLFLNPASNAGLGASRLAITRPELVSRVQPSSRLVKWSTHPLAPLLGDALLATLGSEAILAALTVLAGCVALMPTLSRGIRSVPHPDRWQHYTAPARDTPHRAPAKADEPP